MNVIPVNMTFGSARFSAFAPRAGNQPYLFNTCSLLADPFISALTGGYVDLMTGFPTACLSSHLSSKSPHLLPESRPSRYKITWGNSLTPFVHAPLLRGFVCKEHPVSRPGLKLKRGYSQPTAGSGCYSVSHPCKYTGFLPDAETFILSGGSLRLFHTSDRLQQTIHVGETTLNNRDVEPVGQS